MYKIDAMATQWINGFSGHSALLDELMILVSVAGVPLMVLAVVLQWWTRVDRQHTRHVLLAAGLSFLVGLGANQIILLFIQRMRPYEAGLTHLMIAPTTDFSFPSDHSTAAFAIATTFLVHGMRSRGLSFLAAACCISISRVYLGTHYVSDVAGGALIALIAAALVALVYRPDTRLDRAVTSIL